MRDLRVIALSPPPDPPVDVEKRRGIGGALDAPDPFPEEEWAVSSEVN